MNKQGYKFNILLNSQGVCSRKGGGQDFAWVTGNSLYFSNGKMQQRDHGASPENSEAEEFGGLDQQYIYPQPQRLM